MIESRLSNAPPLSRMS